ncbi:hypothetical protein [Kribbella sp. NPDC051620]|uniref:hypothetical protein n=1 Tax=Kribbella sp. NPDC051620 TaxID=3364120 RepID=UPI00378F3602
MEGERTPVVWWLFVAAAGILAIGLVVQIVLRDSEPSADSGGSSGVASPSVAVSTPSPQLPGIACLEYPPMPNPAAPAYQGRGPHLIIPGSPGPAFATELHPFQIDEGFLPRDWLPANHSDFTAHWWTSSQAALIFCPTEIRQVGKKPVGTCDWIGEPSTKVYPARWTFAVYEIRTGRQVSTFTLASDGSAGGICPPSMQSPPSDSAQPPASAALKAALTPLVTRDVP